MGVEPLQLIMYSKATQTKKKFSTVKSERKRLIKQLDDIVREIVCQDHTCVCCGKYSSVIQPGHFITRSIYALRWDLRNVWPQCPGCNLRHNYDPAPYASFLIRTQGAESIDKLIEAKHQSPKVTVVRMREIKQELEQLCGSRK